MTSIHRARRLAVAAAIAVATSCSTGPGGDASTVALVEVRPASHTMLIPTNAFLQLSATPRNEVGAEISGGPASWSSSATAVATVNGLGIVTAVGVGTTVITVSIDGITGTSTITVAPDPVASVTLSLARSLLVAGETSTAVVVVKDGLGQVVNNPSVTFTSTDPAVVGITSTGIISAIGAGAALIGVNAGTYSAQAPICVTATTPNLRVEFVTLTQSVQTLVGTIPLVSGGLPASVRVHATNSAQLPVGCTVPRFRLIAWSGPTEVLRMEADALSPLPRLYSPLSPVARFIIPSEFITSSLRISVAVDPANSWTETNESDNAWPASGESAAVSVTDVPRIQLRFVPIALAEGNSMGEVEEASIDTYLYGLRQLYPISGVDWDVAEPLSSGVVFTGGGVEPWFAILSDLNFRRVVEGSSRYYSGVVRPPPTAFTTQIWGLGYIPIDLTTTEGATRTSVFVGTGWVISRSSTSNLVAHELGHNHGRFHPPCGTGAGQDRAYPYANGNTGFPGTDMYTHSRTGAPPNDMTPEFRYDFMGSCPTLAKWVSDYTYQALIAARQAVGTVSEMKRVPCECLVVWGSVQGDSITLNPTFVTNTFVQVPSGRGSVTVEGVREDGSVAFSQAVEPGEIDHAPGVRHFIFTVPVSHSDNESLASIRASGRGRSVILQRSASTDGHLSLRTAATQATFRRATSGRGILTLPATVRGALVRSTSTGAVLAVSRVGSVTLDPRHEEVDVVLSDGVRSETVRLRRQPR